MKFTSFGQTALIAFAALAPMLLSTSCKAGAGSVGIAQSQQPLFAPAPNSPIPVGKQPWSIVVGDLNADRKLDLVTANTESDDVTVLLGDRSGGFKPSSGSPFKVRKAPKFIAVGDLNRDGSPDLAITPHDGGYDVTILLGDGKGRFQPAPNSPVTPLKATDPHTHGLALADVDGDGNLDIVTANAGLNKGKADNSVSALLGNGRVVFKSAIGSPFQLGRMPADIVLGDLNLDGKIDLATTNEGSRDISVMLGNGSGAFIAATGSPFSLPAYGNFLAAGDVNTDKNPDLVMTHDDSTLMTILLGDGKGDFKAARGSPLELGRHAWNIIIVDSNGDGKRDLIMRSQDNSVMVLLGDGSSGFTPAPGSPFPVGADPLGIAVGDVNADGKLDILTGNTGSHNVTVLLGR